MPACETWLAGLHLLGRALLADILYSDWAFSMMRLSEEPSRYGIWVQRWRVRSSEDEGEQGPSVKHSTSDDPAILYLISSSTTRLVISLSSRETPDATRAAMVTEKHLASHSVAWVGSVLPSMHFAMRCLLQVLEKWIQISSFCTLTKSWCMNVPDTELSSVLSRTALMALY